MVTYLSTEQATLTANFRWSRGNWHFQQDLSVSKDQLTALYILPALLFGGKIEGLSHLLQRLF